MPSSTAAQKTAPHALEPDTQALALDAARAALQSDSHLDRPTASIHLPLPLVDALLEARGWTIVGRRDAELNFIAPDGKRYWHRDEALLLALTAEAFDMDPELTDAI